MREYNGNRKLETEKIEKKDYLFIINPNAGQGKKEKLINIIEKKLKSKYSYEIFSSADPEQAYEEILQKGIKFNRVVAVGGDGTLQLLLEGVIKSGGNNIGIIPAGTGNDLIRALGIPSDIEGALDYLLDNEGKDVDVGRVNNRYFLNIASLGFDAEVVVNHTKFKKLGFRKSSYILAVFYTMLHYRKKKLKVEIDGKLYEENMVITAIGNGTHYGGGLPILPMALVDDGYFHIIIIKDLSNLGLFLLFPLLFFKKHLLLTKYVEIIKGKRVKVFLEDEKNLNLDGEIFQEKSSLDFEILSKRINVN